MEPRRVAPPTLPAVNQVIALLTAYLLGSVSFAILVASSRGVDIRSEGSGNPGTSNVMRVLGKKLAGVVLVGDAIKGALAAGIATALVDATWGWVALFVAVVGHAFPIWHGFRGGRSVATAIGGVLFLAPLVGIVLAAIWIVIVLVWKTASVASLVTMVLLVPGLAVTGRSGIDLLWAGATAAFVIVRHSENIGRLVRSEERTVT